jgi:hypothetical protein
MEVVALEKVEFHLPRSTHVEVGGANLAIDDILISNMTTKLFFVLDLERTTIVG